MSLSRDENAWSNGRPAGIWMYFHSYEYNQYVSNLLPGEFVWTKNNIGFTNLTPDIECCDHCNAKFKDGDDIVMAWIASED